MTFLIMLLVLANVYLVWRITDQLPDIVFRLSEIQRDIAEVRRHFERTAPVYPPADDNGAQDGP